MILWSPSLTAGIAPVNRDNRQLPPSEPETTILTQGLSIIPSFAMERMETERGTFCMCCCCWDICPHHKLSKMVIFVMLHFPLDSSRRSGCWLPHLLSLQGPWELSQVERWWLGPRWLVQWALWWGWWWIWTRFPLASHCWVVPLHWAQGTSIIPVMQDGTWLKLFTECAHLPFSLCRVTKMQRKTAVPLQF